MRVTSFIMSISVAILVASAALPAVPADSVDGATVGVNLGYVVPGLWDVYYFASTGAPATLKLTWAPGPLVPADYDLRLYRPGALDDNRLLDDELLAAADYRSFTPHTEIITFSGPAAVYVVAVVPFQTQGEVYTLDATPGDLAFATIAPGAYFFCGSACPP